MDFPNLTLKPTKIPEKLKAKNPELEMLYRTLRKEDQAVLDEFFEAIQQHQAAMDFASNMLPMESTLLMMQLEERKWLRQEVNALLAEIQRLRAQLEELKGSQG